MEIVKIKAESRDVFGKKASKSIRNQGKIPAVIYSKNGVSHFVTTHADVKSMVYSPDFKMAEIELGGVSRKALLKDIIFHPVTDAIEHIDFLELIEGNSLKTNIPVKVKGVSPGVKNGGKLTRTLRTVNIKTTPESLVDTLYVDIEKLELGNSVRVRDIETPEGIEILVDGSTPVAKVEIPRILKTEEEEAAEAAALLEEEDETSQDEAEGEDKSE